MKVIEQFCPEILNRYTSNGSPFPLNPYFENYKRCVEGLLTDSFGSFPNDMAGNEDSLRIYVSGDAGRLYQACLQQSIDQRLQIQDKKEVLVLVHPFYPFYWYWDEVDAIEAENESEELSLKDQLFTYHDNITAVLESFAKDPSRAIVLAENPEHYASLTSSFANQNIAPHFTQRDSGLLSRSRDFDKLKEAEIIYVGGSYMEKEACAWEYLLSIKKEFPDKPVFLVPELLMNRVTENMRIQLSEEDIHHDLWSLTNPVNKEFDKQFRLFRALADGTTFLTDLI